MKKLFSLFLITVSLKLNAQVFPVSVALEFPNPLQPYPEEWSNLLLAITQGDLTQGPTDVILKFTITGPGYHGQTNITNPLPRITLDAGIPELIGEEILEEYFQTDNWEMLYGSFPLQGSPVNDGVIGICVEVLLPNGVKISQNTCTEEFFSRCDAPTPLIPVCGETINNEEAYILFSWEHLLSPFVVENGFSSEYRLEIFEWYPEELDPNFIASSAIPVYSEDVVGTTAQVSTAAYPFSEGKKYIWRILATQENYAMVNAGKSNACVFQFGEDLLQNISLTLSLTHNNISSTQTQLQWNPIAYADYYVLQYKSRNSSTIFSVTSSNPNLLLCELEDSSFYEARVIAMSSHQNIAESEWYEWHTLPKELLLCGQTYVPQNPQQFAPLTMAFPGMLIQSGQFEVQIMEAEPLSPTGYYKGKGKIIAWNVLPLAVAFDRIFIDDQLKVRDGKIEAISKGLGGFIADETVGTISNGQAEAETTVNFPADSIKLENGDIVVHGPNGEQESIPFDPESGNTIEDETGSLYIVTTDGQVVHAGTQSEYPIYVPSDTLYNSLGECTLISNAQELYANDAETFPENAVTYSTMVRETGPENYRVAWKFVASHKYDFIALNLSAGINGIIADSVLVMNSRGTKYQFSKTGNVLQGYVIGGEHGDGQELLVLAKHQNKYFPIGKINIAHYTLQEKTIEILHTASNNIPTPNEEALKKALKKVGVLATIIHRENFSWNANWDLDSSGTLSAVPHGSDKYSLEMEMLISQLKSASWYEKNNYYLFFSGVPPNEANLAGVMPRGKHFGFIFPQHVSMPIEKAILHELAHGIGALQHTFDDEYKIPQGNSASVCDYPPGTMFFKYQWDKLHDPGWLNGIADEQEDFALEVFDDIGEWVDIRSLQTPIITPSQKALNISGITQVKFNHGGATVLFRLQNGKIYSAVVGSNGVFYGYVPKELADGLTGVFTVEKANLLQQSLFKGFSHSAMNSEVYAKAFLQQNDVLLNCVCSYFFPSPLSEGNIEGVIQHRIIPSNAEKGECTGNTCYDAEAEGIHSPAGAEYYIKLRPLLSDTTGNAALVQLCRYIDSLTQRNSFAIYGYQLETYQAAPTFSNNRIQYFKTNRILSLQQFKNHFPYVISTYDAPVIFSTKNLWQDVPPGYNAQSVDYEKWKAGDTALYTYSFSDLIVRENFRGNILFNSILNLEAEGKALPLSQSNFFSQYVALYGTNQAFPFIANWAARWSKDILIALTIQRAITIAPELVLSQGARNFMKDVFIGAVIDFLIDAMVHYYFDEDDPSFSAAMGRVDYYQITASGLENAFSNALSPKYSLIISSCFACLTSGFLEDGRISNEFKAYECGQAVIAAVIANKLSHPAFLRLLSKPFYAITRGLKKFGCETWDEIKVKAKFFGVEIPPVFEQMGKRAISKLNGFSDNIAGYLSTHGLSRAEFDALCQKRYDELTDTERAKILAIRNAIPQPDANTLMQKVIPLNKIDDYTVKGYLPKGFVSKANDTKHLKSYEDYYHGLRLDYKDKAGMYPFNIYDEGCYVIRFKARDSHLATPPIDTKSNSEFPFTDHGFTSANEGRLSCPEYEMENPAEVTEGVIYRVLPSGVEVPFAIFDETTSKFIEL
jgi:hypothetical protein